MEWICNCFKAIGSLCYKIFNLLRSRLKKLAVNTMCLYLFVVYKCISYLYSNIYDKFLVYVSTMYLALYHQTLLDAHNKIGQTDAWYSTNPLAKRPRYESTSHLPIYPQRPGEKDCGFYMQTRTCKFGESCKFDHPIWVPEGGIPDWKEVIFFATYYLVILH